MTNAKFAAERWNQRFDRPDFLFGTEPAAVLRRHAHLIAPVSRVLAVADGEGRNSVWLARQGHRVTAFDVSERGLEKARALAAGAGVSIDFHLAGVEGWDWTAEPYDAVVALYIQFAGPALRAEVFAGIDAALRPGGLLLLAGFAPRQVGYGTGGPPHAENMYTLPMLHAAFPGYRVLHEADHDDTVDAGPGHNGLAAMVEFVARRPEEG